MDSSRIVELLAPFVAPAGVGPLSSAQLDQISTYIDLLLRWNARVNLTAVRTPEEIVTRHFGESLFAARHLLPRSGDAPVQGTALSEPSSGFANDPRPTANGAFPDNLVDIGSGAGFPGLPIKIWSPQTRVTLIESNHKKVAFLREVIRTLTLIAIDVFPARAETFPPATATIVTLRAVERFTQTLPTALSLLAPGARLALLISHPQFPQAQALTPSLHWSEPISIPLSNTRILTIGTN